MLVAGSQQIYAESKIAGAFTRRSIDVAAGEHKTGIDLELDLAGSIAGTVVDQAGVAVADAVVRVSLLHGTDYGTATTGVDGRFVVRALAGGGDYLVDVHPNATGAARYRPAVGRRHPSITVRDGRTAVTGIRIAVQVDHLALGGRLLTAAGGPVPDATIRITTSTRWDMNATTTTDASGRFALHDLSPGTYDLVASTLHGDARLDSVTAGRTDLVMRLREAGTIEGTLANFAEPPDVTASTRYEPAKYHATVTGSSLRVRGVEPGTYTLIARSASGLATATATVAPGGVARVALTNTGVGRITGTVVDAVTHRRLAGAWCIARGDIVANIRTDEAGGFAFPRVAPGVNRVTCADSAEVAVTVAAGATSRADLVGHERAQLREVHLGMELENQLGDVMVKSIEPGGLAARAGFAREDILERVDDLPVTGPSDSVLETIQLVVSRAPVKITVQRGDGQLVITLAPPPSPE